MKNVLIMPLLFLYFHVWAPPPETDHYRTIGISYYGLQKFQFLNSLDTLTFSPENLQRAIYFLEIKQPEMVFKQAILETGYFTSRIWKQYNNLFGMKMASKRNCHAYGKINKYGTAGYYHWSGSVKDMKEFQEYWSSKGWDLENGYESFLKKLPYAVSTHYVQALYKIKI